METVALICGMCASIFLASIMFFLIHIDKENDSYAHAFMGWVMGISICSFFYFLCSTICPLMTAMDVYRGKTTLKYEIVDGVKVDSIVVWKKNINE